MPATIQDRLKAAMKGGNLRVADLVRWFDRPDPTIRGWVNGVEPGGAASDKDDVEHRLTTLEKLIKGKKHFPLAPRMSPQDRIKSIEGAVRQEL